MSTVDHDHSRRYAVPLWLVPILFIGAVLAVYYSSLGGLGIVGVLYLLARVQPKVDAYVRRRELSDD